MGSLIKQTVNSVVFMEDTSTADDLRAVTLEIDCEGSGRFFKLSNTKDKSVLYFHHPDDFKLIHESAVALWSQGDIYAPGDVDPEREQPAKPVLSPLMPEAAVPDGYRLQPIAEFDAYNSVTEEMLKELGRFKLAEKANNERWAAENAALENLVVAALNRLNAPEDSETALALRQAILAMGFCLRCQSRDCSCHLD